MSIINYYRLMIMTLIESKESENRASVGFGDEYLAFKVPSSVASIGSAIQKLNRFLKSYGVSELSTTEATIVLRELLVNAITHGNKGNDSVPVSITIEHLRGNEFKIVVEDMGNGFNYAAIDTGIPENPRAIPNRGYALIKTYTDHFEFNDRGNRVAAYFSTRSCR